MDEIQILRKTDGEIEHVMYMKPPALPRIGEAFNLVERGEGVLRIIDIEWYEIQYSPGQFRAVYFCEAA